jgi:hypothetical protein
MFAVRLFAALLLMTLGCAYLFQKDTILRLNAFMRERVFHDSHVLLNRSRVGAALIIAGLVLLTIAFKVHR